MDQNTGSSGCDDVETVDGDDEIAIPIRDTVIVEVCVTFLKIGEIDTLKEQFEADVMVQSFWREPSFDAVNKKTLKNVDWNKQWNPQILIENITGNFKESAFRSISQDSQKRAFVTEKRRIKGTFLETLELMDFPFDIQDLSVTVTSDKPKEQVNIVEASETFHSVSRRSFIDEQEWYLYKYISAETKELVNEYSDPVIRKSALYVKCQAARRPTYFIWNHFLITFLICSLSFATFSVDKNLPQNRLQLSFTLVLTSVAFKFVVNQSLPTISYLTYLDKYVLATLIILVLVCTWHGLSATLFTDQRGHDGDLIDYLAFIGFIVLYAVFNIIFMILIALKPGRKRHQMRNLERSYTHKIKHSLRIKNSTRFSITSQNNKLGVHEDTKKSMDTRV